MSDEKILNLTYEVIDLVKETKEYKDMVYYSNILKENNEYQSLLSKYNDLKEELDKNPYNSSVINELSIYKTKLMTMDVYINYNNACNKLNELLEIIEKRVDDAFFNESFKKLKELK